MFCIYYLMFDLQVDQNTSSNAIQSHLVIDPITSSDDAVYTCTILDETRVQTFSFSLDVNNSMLLQLYSSVYDCKK